MYKLCAFSSFYVCLAAISFASDASRICEFASSSGFFEEMAHMASTSEFCEGDCDTNVSVVREKVLVNLFSGDLDAESVSDVNDSISWAVRNVNEVIGEIVDIKMSSELNELSEVSTIFYIFPLTESLDAALIERGLPGLSPEGYVYNHRNSLINGSCSGRIFSDGDTDQQNITRGYIFIGEENLEDKGMLDRCALEELTQAFGLFGDPIGSDSLFDNGNIDVSTGRVKNSQRTNAMLEYIYSGNKMESSIFYQYVEKLCKK